MKRTATDVVLETALVAEQAAATLRALADGVSDIARKMSALAHEQHWTDKQRKAWADLESDLYRLKVRSVHIYQ